MSVAPVPKPANTSPDASTPDKPANASPDATTKNASPDAPIKNGSPGEPVPPTSPATDRRSHRLFAAPQNARLAPA